MNNNKGRFFYCYNEGIYRYLKGRGHWYIFSGYTLKHARVIVFEVTEQLTEDLQEFYRERCSVNESW